MLRFSSEKRERKSTGKRDTMREKDLHVRAWKGGARERRHENLYVDTLNKN